jgi:hypothetical protein
MAYRKIKGRDVWHWCKNCSKWPKSNYDERSGKPSSNELCDECRSKAKRGDCRR